MLGHHAALIGPLAGRRYANVLDDWDMAATGADVIVDGDMEQTGTDVIVDGDMEAAGTGAYASYGSAVLTKETTDPYEGARCLRAAYGGTSTYAAYQSCVVLGVTYRLKGVARSNGVSVPELRNSSNVLWTGTTSTDWQSFDVVFVAAGTTIIYLTGLGSSGFVEFDDIQVIQQTGTGGACEDWTAGNSALLSKQNDAYEGSQCLRIAYGGTFGPSAKQTVLTTGYAYTISGWVRGDGTTGARVYLGGTLVFTSTADTTWQNFNITAIAPAAYIAFYAWGSSGYVEFDDISVVQQSGAGGACEDWTSGNNALLSKQPGVSGQCIRVEHLDTADPYAEQTKLTVGKSYQLTGLLRGDGTYKPYITDGVNTLWTGSASTSWQTVNVRITAAGTTLRIYSDAAAANGYSECDNLLALEFAA